VKAVKPGNTSHKGRKGAKECVWLLRCASSSCIILYDIKNYKIFFFFSASFAPLRLCVSFFSSVFLMILITPNGVSIHIYFGVILK